MNPENPPSPRDELEVRLTALLMGELPPEEAAALEARLAAEPELAALHGRLRKAMELLREATALPEQPAPTTPLQLSSERRERLLAHFQKTPAPALAPLAAPARFAPVVKKPKRDWSWALSLGLAAALVALVGASLLIPNFGLRQRKAAYDGPEFYFHASDDVSNQTLAKPPESIGAVSGVFTDPQFQVVMRPQLAQRSAGGTFDAQSSSSIKGGLAYTPSGKEFAAYKAAPPQARAMQSPATKRGIGIGSSNASAIPKIAAASSDVETLGALSTDSPPAAPHLLYLGEGTTLARKDVAAVPSEATATFNFGQAVTGSALTAPSVQLQDRALGEDDKRAFATAKNGAGTWALKGANTYTGSTTVNAGTLSLNGTSDVNGNIDMGSIGSITNRGGQNAVTLNPSAGVPNQSNTYAGTTTVTGGTLSVTTGSATTFAGNITGNTRGVGALTKSGGGTLVLNGATIADTTKAPRVVLERAPAVTLPQGEQNVFFGGGTVGRPIAAATPAPEQPAQPANQKYAYVFTRRETRPAPKGTPSIESREVAQAPSSRAVPVEKARMQVLKKSDTPAKQEAKPESLHSPVDVLSFNDGAGKSKEVRFKEQHAQAAFPITPTTPSNVVAGEPVRLQEEREQTAAGADVAGTKKKLPLVGDVPVVGHLFKREPADAGGLSEQQLAEAAKAGPKDYYNKTIGPKFRQQVEQVKQWSEEAQGLYDSGRLDLAKKRAEQILSFDPTNQAARDFEKKIDRSLNDYGVAANNETRASAIAQTDLAWARPAGKPNAGTEIQQNNLKELSFDWLLGATPVPGPQKPKHDELYTTVDELLFDSPVPGMAAKADQSAAEGAARSAKSDSQKKLMAQKERLEKASAALMQIRARDGIVDSDPDKNNSSIGYSQQRTAFDESTKNTQELVVLQTERQLEMINNLSPEQLQDALSTLGISDPTISRNLPLLQDATAEKARLSNLGVRANDPRIKALDAQMATYAKTLGDQLNTIKDTQAKKLRLEKDKLNAFQETAKNSRSSEIEEKARISEYVNAKNRYLQAKKTLEAAVPSREQEAPPKIVSSPDVTPQPEIRTSENAFSTFSLNVSDVSFKLAAASLEKGQMPDPANVRSEEFVNAFDYRDPEPAPGAPLAFVAERARYPFAQNRDLVRFAVKTAAAGRQAGRPLNIVLLLDKSGSMERADRVNIVREALRVLTAQLQPQDKLSIVTFARTPRLWADGVAGDKAGETIARVNEITPEGGTNLEAALDLGYATALRHFTVGSVSRVVLFTDGAANLGDVNPEALEKKVEAHRQQGVALDCFGIGWEGYNDDLLEQLTHHGDGRYGFINTPEEAADNFATQLAGALQVAAADVKVQVEFNPRRVTAYRQIGYAKHQLTKEQFRDNTVDAAEIGAAESGNALYVVEVDPRGEGDLATVRVRFKVPGTSDYREHEWPVPFAGNALPLEQASSTLRLAGTAGAFSEMLAGYAYAAEVTSDRLLGVLNGVPAIYDNDPRPKKLEWMIRQARSLSGR